MRTKILETEHFEAHLITSLATCGWALETRRKGDSDGDLYFNHREQAEIIGFLKQIPKLVGDAIDSYKKAVGIKNPMQDAINDYEKAEREAQLDHDSGQDEDSLSDEE